MPAPMWASVLAGAFGRDANAYVNPDSNPVIDPDTEVFRSRYLRDLYRHAYLTGEPVGQVQEPGSFFGGKGKLREPNDLELFANKMGVMARDKVALQQKADKMKEDYNKLTLMGKEESSTPEAFKMKRDQAKANLDYVQKQIKHMDFLEKTTGKVEKMQRDQARSDARWKFQQVAAVLKPEISSLSRQELAIGKELNKLKQQAFSGQDVDPEIIRGLTDQQKQTRERLGDLQQGLRDAASEANVDIPAFPSRGAEEEDEVEPKPKFSLESKPGDWYKEADRPFSNPLGALWNAIIPGAKIRRRNEALVEEFGPGYAMGDQGELTEPSMESDRDKYIQALGFMGPPEEGQVMEEQYQGQRPTVGGY